MFKGALLGFGAVAEAAHAPALRARAREFHIAAVADAVPERLEKAAALFPGARLYTKGEELFAKETQLDFVDIATPPGTHARLAQHALQRRLHVLVEKPLALNLKDLASLRAQAAAQDRSLYTVHNWKSAPQYAKLGELAASGVLGGIRHAELHTLRTRPAQAAAGSWRSDPANGGILVDHGWHAFYLARHLAGQAPTHVSCRARGGSAEADEVSVLIEFAAADALIYLSWGSAYRSNWAVVYGSKATAELRDDHILVRYSDGREERHDFAAKVSAGSAHPDWFEAMLPDFAAEMRDARLRGRNLEEAETVLRLLTCAQQSQRMGGKSVPLPAFAGSQSPVAGQAV